MFGRRVFILGAGASAFAGYPLAGNLLTFLRDNFQYSLSVTRNDAADVLGKLQRAAEALQRQTRESWDLETLLTHMDLYGNVGNLKLVYGSWTEMDRMQLVAVVAEAFQWHQYKLRRMVWDTSPGNLQINVDPNRVRSVADSWASVVRPGDTIISFNWDLLHESIMWRAGNWSYVDGYGFTIPNAPAGEPLSKVPLYKLHGSVNWAQAGERDDTPEIQFARDIFLGAHPPSYQVPPKAAAHDAGRKLILPTYLKDISKNSALLRVWVLAQDALRQTSEICVIGYSLNPADHPARFLLATELRRNTSIRQITLVTPPVNVPGRTLTFDTPAGRWQEFLQGIGKKLDWIKKTFEEWLSG